MADNLVPNRFTAFEAAVQITKEAKRGGDGKPAGEILRETYGAIVKIYEEILESDSVSTL